jgi:glycosyltransferase involved in cell wall biosynthesis
MPNMNIGRAQVDVIVPCYNYGRFLAQCIDSALSQHVPVRVLIIDDASQDCTEQVGRSLAAQHKEVEYRRHSANKGHIATYNEGIEWLESEYMILLSADDMLAEGSLSAVLPILVAYPAMTLLYGQAVKFVDAPPVLPPPAMPPHFTIIQGWRFIEELCRTNENPVASPAAAIVRTSTQRQVGGYLGSGH